VTVWREGAPCAACGSPLAADQRYCLACGTRRAGAGLGALLAPAVVAVPVPPAAGPALSLLPPRSAAALTAVVLGMGVMIGAALGPATVGSPLAAQRAVLVMGAASAGGSATGAAALVAPPSLGAPDAVDPGTLASSPAAPADTGAAAATGGDGGGTPTATTPASTTPTTTTTTPTTTTPAPPAHSTLLAGTVVHVNDQAAGYVIADADGRLLAIHDSAPPKLGATVQTHARKLANDTWSDTSFEQGTPAKTATLAGVVTAVDSGRGAYVVSARGVSLVVDVPGAGASPAPAAPAAPGCPVPAGTASATSTTPVASTATTSTTLATPTTTTPTMPTTAPPPLPPVGTQVKVDVRVVAPAKGVPARLEQVTRSDDAATTKPLEFEGIVCAVDATARTVTLTDDDLGELGATLTVHAGPAFKLDQIPPQSEVAFTASPRPDGTFDLTGVSADGGAVAADDDAYVQGDQRRGG
jgi:hypothetical protein